MKKIMLVAAVFSWGWGGTVFAELSPFDTDSMREIESNHQGRPFIVALWATDCAPCRGELALLRRFADEHPSVAVVLIASDNIENAQAVQDILAEYGLENVESWVFADPNRERLQFAVDPQWFGEVPRAYLYAPSLERSPVSGTLAASRLDAWLESLVQ